MEDSITGRDLLEAAAEWYKSNDNALIPESGDIGHSPVKAQDLRLSYNHHFISNEGESISHIPANVIPLLAAISLGFNDEEIARLVVSQEISLDQITNLDFSSQYVNVIGMNGDDEAFLTNAKICIAVAKAFFASPDKEKELANELTGFTNESMKLASMHIEDTSLWPVTMIEEHISDVMKGGSPGSYFKDCGGAVSEPYFMDELPNGSASDLIDRSGMASESVIRKQPGRYSLWESIVFEAMHGKKPQVAALKHIASATDPEEISSFTRGLLSISANSTHHEFIPQLLHRTLKEFLDCNPAFKVVTDSVIVKLNLLGEHEYKIGIPELSRRETLFEEISNEQHTLLSRVASEILSRRDDLLGLSELTVFTKIIHPSLPPQDITFSPEDLINKLLTSWETFVSPARTRDRVKAGVDKEAGNSIINLVKLLGKTHKLDHELFNHRSDDAKVLLIDAGMEVKKFKGLGRQAMGRVLENDLGM